MNYNTCRNIVMDKNASWVEGMYRSTHLTFYVRCPRCSSDYGPYSSLSEVQTYRDEHLSDCDCRKSVSEETNKLFASLRKD